MSKYTALIQDLESSTESFSQLAKKHGHKSSIAHAALTKIRPDLLGPRSARLGFTQVNKSDIPDNVRADALAQVLAGRSVKDVANETGVPAPTLYQMARKAREKEAAHSNIQASAAPSPAANAVLDVLTAQLQAAADQLHMLPQALCDLLKARLSS